jgi:hypothetical protein
MILWNYLEKFGSIEGVDKSFSCKVKLVVPVIN